MIRGLPDDGNVHLVKIGPPCEFNHEGTASFLTQMAADMPWNTVWVGPASPMATKLLPGPIVNYIADPDMCLKALRAACDNAARSDRLWFNHPARIMATTRDRVSRTLQGIEGLIVPKVVRCRPTCAADIVKAVADGDLRYPVLVRSAGEHGGRTLVRVDGPQDEIELELSAASGNDLYVTEFYDFGDEDGLYRRYRFAVVGGEVFIKSIIMGPGWNLHASSRIWNDATIAQERSIIDSFDTVLAPKIKPMIDAIYDRLGLDFFGVDCAVRSDGSVVVFEANATMNILVDIQLKPDLWSERTERIRAALLSLLQDPTRWAATRPEPRVTTVLNARSLIRMAEAMPVRASEQAVRPEPAAASLTAGDVLTKCMGERRIRDGLALSDTGQIADSYDTLHSVRLITAILDSIPVTLPEGARARYLFFILGRCFDANLVELCDWARRDVRNGATDQAANTLLWIERLLRLKHDIGLFRSFAASDHRIGAEQPESAFLAALDTLSDALLTHFGQAGFPAIGAAESLTGADAMLFHRAKNIVLLAKEDALSDPLPDDVAPDIVAAHLQCVAAAAAGLAMNRPTHINQFCLLHQVPELIVPTVLRLWTSIESDLAAGDLAEARDHAQVAGDLLSIMVLSIAPLAEILYPSEYFKFRGNLGATSGSSSAALRGKLLTTAYVRLAEHMVAQGAKRGASGHPHQRLMEQIARNRDLLYKWRALHMALPRNVLGSDGTKSLMGSPDALKAVSSMADAFAGKDPLTATLGRVTEFGFAPAGATARLDAALLSETGRVARDEFWQVQERIGPWAKTRKQTA
ncbi:MAG: hypothetical protein V4618_21445 [Pseudomonadota bacterium]